MLPGPGIFDAGDDADRSSLAVSVGRHTAYNLAGAILPLALSLLTIPVYLNLIGEARYGVLSVAFLLLGYFGLFDLGLGAATAQRIAALDDASPEERASTFWTALMINLGLGCLGGALIWPAALYFFGHMFNVDPMIRAELLAAIPWLALALPLATLSGVLTGALQGRSQFLELNIVSLLTSALTQIVPLTVAWLLGADLALLLPAVVFTRLVAIAILFFRCRVHVLQGSPARYSPQYAKQLLKFGGWVTLTSVVGPMMVILDRLVIGATLGAKSVTHYTVPFQLVEKSSVLPAALTSALFPRLAGRPGPEAHRLSMRAVRSLAVSMTPVFVLGIFLIKPFLAVWLDDAFAARAGLSGQILMLGFWINALARVPYVLLQAEGRPDVVAKCHLAELLPYLSALYIGLNFWGLQGAAAAFGLRALADFGLLMYLARMPAESTRALAVPALLLAAALTAVLLFAMAWAYWSVAAGMVALSFFWAWRNAPEELHAMLAHPGRFLAVSRNDR